MNPLLPPHRCCGETTRATGHGNYICVRCARKYDRHGRRMHKTNGHVMRGVDIDAIHYKRGAIRKKETA